MAGTVKKGGIRDGSKEESVMWKEVWGIPEDIEPIKT